MSLEKLDLSTLGGDDHKPQGISVQRPDDSKSAGPSRLDAVGGWIKENFGFVAMLVFIAYISGAFDRFKPDPRPEPLSGVVEAVEKFGDKLDAGLADAHRELAAFCDGRNPSPAEILEKSKELSIEAFKSAGSELSGLDNKYLRDGTPSERVEYLESVAAAFEDLR